MVPKVVLLLLVIGVLTPQKLIVRASSESESSSSSVTEEEEEEEEGIRGIPLDELWDILDDQINAEINNEPIPPSPFEEIIAEIECDPNAEFRTIDGTCNNLHFPLWGASSTPEPRLLPCNRYQDQFSDPPRFLFDTRDQHGNRIKLPSARTVSSTVHHTTSNLDDKNVHLLMTFAQFVDHDIVGTPAPEGNFNEGGAGLPDNCCFRNFTELTEFGECFPIFIKDDPDIDTDCIGVVRSIHLPGLPGDEVLRYQVNEVTSFVDASMAYGSNGPQAAAIRFFQGGQFTVRQTADGMNSIPLIPEGPGGTIPSDAECLVQDDTCRFLAGDTRATEQAALTAMHTLWVREHNRIATEIHALDPNLDDEEIYQISRKILAAVTQRITYGEFLPIILSDKILSRFGLKLLDEGRFTKYDPCVNPGVNNEFQTAAFRFGHSLIRETFTLNQANGPEPIFFIFDNFRTIQLNGDTGLLLGMTTDKAETNDAMITSGVRDNLFNLALDLPALNIQRGRDHGIGSYNDHRKFFNLRIFDDYADIVDVTHSQADADNLESVYPSIHDAEIFPAGMSEIPLPGGLLGETFSHIIADMFHKLRVGDRFWHETDDEVVGFTDDQLEQIRKASMADIFCNNVPGFEGRPDAFSCIDPEHNPATPCDQIPTLDFSVFVGDEARRRRRRPKRRTCKKVLNRSRSPDPFRRRWPREDKARIWRQLRKDNKRRGLSPRKGGLSKRRSRLTFLKRRIRSRRRRG